MVFNSFKPPVGAKTTTKGWAETTGWDRHETISIVDRVKDHHMTNAAAIVDILEANTVKNSFNHTNPEVVRYFLIKYEQQIKEALKLWASKEASRLALLQNMAKNIGGDSPTDAGGDAEATQV